MMGERRRRVHGWRFSDVGVGSGSFPFLTLLSLVVAAFKVMACSGSRHYSQMWLGPEAGQGSSFLERTL